MIRAILFDGDGVIINKPIQFSEHLSKDLNVPMEKILPFFKNEFQLCLVGKADLKEVIKPYLKDWNWDKSVDELLEYWFQSENYIDKNIVEDIARYKASGIKCYLHSNQEKYRTNFMRDKMGLDKIVDGIFSSAYLGVKKPQSEFWQMILDKIGPLEKTDVLVWDDDEENVVSARNFGYHSEFYKGYDSFGQTMSGYLK